jgi:mono/diheme cytochrome c family protein
MAVSSKFGWGLVLTASILFACNESTPSSPSPKKAIPLGEELYLSHCASCHGEKGDLGVSGAKNLKTTSLSLKEIKQMIKTGKNAMPSFSGVLGSTDRIDSVAAYVNTLHQ